jgi:hypothetical protein
LYQWLGNELNAGYGIHPVWRTARGRVMGATRAWYTAEQGRRQSENCPGVTQAELLAYAESIVRRDYPELLGEA